MKRHPYGVTGKCQRCARALASSRCTDRTGEQLLCNLCADRWFDALRARLDARNG